MNRKKILFVSNEQFGYLTDTYKYCEKLKDDYDITYFCFDKGLERFNIDGIRIKYIDYSGNKTIRGLRFLVHLVFLAAIFRGFIFLVYFPKSELVKLALPWKRIHLDVRTLSVVSDTQEREAMDRELRRTCKRYDTVSAISNGVIQRLAIGKVSLLPLGADIISSIDKSFETLNLLYVGTLNNRKMLKTVKGLELYVKRHPQISVHYDIVGDGEEYREISMYISNHRLEQYVSMYGSIPHYRLKEFFDTNNVGVSFVPITEYYQFQPPTKTFEYALSGLYTIATGTFANREIITKDNGCIIDDNPEAFAKAIEYIATIRNELNSSCIRTTVAGYNWEEIVRKYLVPIIEKSH